MKHLLIILLVLSGGNLSAQHKATIFHEGEQAAGVYGRSFSGEAGENATDPPTFPPSEDEGPSDPPKFPVDDYIPVLFMVAIGLIVFKQKQLQHRKNSIKRF